MIDFELDYLICMKLTVTNTFKNNVRKEEKNGKGFFMGSSNLYEMDTKQGPVFSMGWVFNKTEIIQNGM